MFRLLNPHIDSSASLYVGNLITQLVRRLPGEMGPHLHQLLAALVARMQSSLMPALTISLLLVVARLVRISRFKLEKRRKICLLSFG